VSAPAAPAAASAEEPKLRIGRIWRRVLAVAKWTAGIVLVLVLLFIGINLFDEDLSQEAKALLIAQPNPYRPEENLYLALLGFEAERGRSPTAAGEARVAVYEKEAAAALKDPPTEINDFPDHAWQKRQQLHFAGNADFCQPLTKSCLTGVEIHRREINQLLRVNRELYGRYSRLHDLKGYYETATPSQYFMIAYPPSSVRQLYLANIALRALARDRLQRKTSIADLLADIRTWRRELTGSGSLISKMLAVANLQGDYALLADMLADGRIDLEDNSDQIRSVLEQPEDDWKIGSIFAFEYRLRAYVWEQVRVRGPHSFWDFDSWVDQVTSLFFKKNATQNLEAKLMMRFQALEDSDPAKFLAARDDHRKWLRDHLDFGVHFIYNPIGKTLMNVASNTYEGYYLRSFDGAAFQRLTRLGFEIRIRKIDDKAIPSFMQQHPQWASHPVDGSQFVWDEKKREIAVQTMGQQPKDRRFSIPVWSAAAT
jgi:hypothetical protein